MLISEKYKFIFIHIQKTGGTSLMDVLAREVPDLKPLCFKHDGAKEGILKLGENEWKKYYKFAIVRNPWDRLVSWYSMIINTPEKVAKLREYARNNARNFEEFLLNCTSDISDFDGTQSFVKNQLDYLLDSQGKLSVDYIGRFEDLEKSCNLFIEKIGLGRKINLPHVNHSSTHLHYSTYYTEKTRNIAKERFSKDIDYFKYEFQKKNLLIGVSDKVETLIKRKRYSESTINYMSALEKGGFKDS